jgi:hypothetical protein
MRIPLIKATADLAHVLKTSLNFSNHSALYKELLTVQKIRQEIIQNGNYKLLSFNRKYAYMHSGKHG